MNKDLSVIIAFLAMTFGISLAGHVFFKQGLISKWAIERQIEQLHEENSHVPAPPRDHHEPADETEHQEHDSHEDPHADEQAH